MSPWPALRRTCERAGRVLKMDVLARILAVKSREIAAAQAVVSPAEMKRRALPRRRRETSWCDAHTDRSCVTGGHSGDQTGEPEQRRAPVGFRSGGDCAVVRRKRRRVPVGADRRDFFQGSADHLQLGARGVRGAGAAKGFRHRPLSGVRGTCDGCGLHPAHRGRARRRRR